MTTNHEIQAVTYKAVLVDGGSEGNLVAKYIIDALKARTVPVNV
jgi:hypothetical protein